MICYECGQMVGEGKFTIINNKVYCNDCTIECVDCGEIIPKDIATRTVNGYVCEYCLDNYYFCDNCEEYYHNLDTTYINGATYCDSCRDDLFTVCNDCGEWVNLDDALWVEDGEYYICENCYDDYATCESCGDIIHYDNAHCANDCYYCETCYEDIPKFIHGYHSYNDFSMRRTEDDKDKYGFGFELEVAGDEDYAEEFLEEVGGEQDLVLMHDGSVDGFEIVTQPMTVSYFDEVFKPTLEKGLKFLINKDFEGHNKGGLHIHVSNQLITTGMLAQLREILYSKKYSDKNTWLRITQRHESEMDRWSSMENDINSFQDIIENGCSNISDSRYTALRFDTRTFTYEFRIFNSNLRIERFLKNFECVKALLDYTKQYEEETVPKCSTRGFIKFVKDNKIFYQNLYAFIEEKNIDKLYYTEINEQELEVA